MNENAMTNPVSPTELPSGPAASSWQQAQAWIERPVVFWRECLLNHGDPFTVQLGSIGPTVLFTQPAAVQQVFALSPDQFECRSFNAHYQQIMGDRSLLALDGAEHSQCRQLVTHGLSSPTVSAEIAHHIESWTHDAFGRLLRNQPVDLRAALHKIAFSAVIHLLLPESATATRNLLQNIVLKDLTKDFGSWSPWARFTKWHPLLRQQLDREIEQIRRREPLEFGPQDCARSLLCHWSTARDDRGEWLANQLIHDQVFTMLIAGVDPSALATLWLLYWTHSDESVLDRLRQDSQSIGKSPGKTVMAGSDQPIPHGTAKDYLDAACRESLRMIPVVTTPSGRRLLKPATVGGRRYPAHVTLLPCTYLIHRRPDLYPDPDRYLPQRFLERSFKVSEYLPFGGGRRFCPGSRLALTTMRHVLHTILQHGTLRLIAEGQVVPSRHGTLLAPSPNLRFELLEWRDS